MNEIQALPADLASERFILGSILLDGSRFPEIASALTLEDFALEKHRRIFRRITELDERGEKIDRVTLAGELMRFGELESVDGLAYLCELDTGMPSISNLDAYVDLVIAKSRLRRIAVAAQNIMHRALVGQDSPDEILAGADAAMLDIRPSRSSKEVWKTPGDCIAEYPGGLKALLEPPKATGVLSPFPRLNEMVGGFQKQQLVLLAGRPSHGKSAAALQIAWSAVHEQDTEVAYVSLEMSRESLVQRLVSIHGGADLHRLRVGFLSRDERCRLSIAAGDVEQSRLWIDDRGGQTSAGIRRSVRQLAAKRKIGLVIVDHLHLIRGGDGRGDERQRFSRIADDLQVLAKEMDIPVIALAQCSRQCEQHNKPPSMTDLKETGKLEENADLVIFAYRPEMYGDNRAKEELRGLAEFVIAKQRNGPIGSIPMVFLGAQSKFGERA